MSGGCGDVVFVDPDAELKAELRLVSARRFDVESDPRTYLRVEVASRRGLDGARLYAVASDRTQEIPLGGQALVPCGSGSSCFEIVGGPGLLPGDTAEILLGVPALEHQSRARLVQERLLAYAVDAEPVEDNARARVILERDPIRERLGGARVAGRAPFERSFDYGFVGGACGRTTEVSWIRGPGPVPIELPADFDDQGLGCVVLRPSLPAGGPLVAQRTVPARAVVRSFRHVYVPPEVPAPLVWMTLFDLEIPSPSRCRQAQDAFEASVRAVAEDIAEADRRGAPAFGLSPVQIAEVDGAPCRQAEGRAFDPSEVAERARAELAGTLSPEAQVRLLLLYVTNLALRPPPALQASMMRLPAILGAAGIDSSFFAAIGPEVAVAGLGVEAKIPWVSTLEPAFEDALFALLAQIWPFSSSSHTASTVVPLSDLAGAEDLLAFRICASPPGVTPVGEPLGFGAYRPDPGGPAYTVLLPPMVLEPSSSFRSPTVEVRWEGCYARCERSGPGRSEETSWLGEDTCQP